jgi:hypothetical protein
MIFINSPLSQFEVTNLIGIFAPILGKINIILTNLALYTNNCFCCSLDISFLIVIFISSLFCGVITMVLIYIHFSGKKIIEAVIKNGGTIGAGVVGLVTGLDSAFNLADRMRKGGGSSGSSDSDPDKDKDKDQKEKDDKNNTENKEQQENNDKKS